MQNNEMETAYVFDVDRNGEITFFNEEVEQIESIEE